MCDKENGYLCLECETFLNQEVKDLVKTYKEEITRSGDWWHGLQDWSLNIFQDEEKPGIYLVNAYRLGPNGMDDYSEIYNLESLTLHKVLTADFIEFGEFVKEHDRYPVSVVYGRYQVQYLTETQIDFLRGDWIILDDYQGEIIFAKSRDEVTL
jgi:hypothetical protein